MTVATKLKLGNVILCEHVAEGAHNKPILIGVFSGDVLVSQMPAILRFGLYIEYFPDAPGTVEMGILVALGGTEVVKAMVRADNTKPGEAAVFIIQSFVLNISSPTTLEISMSREGYKKVVALSKAISVGAVVA